MLFVGDLLSAFTNSIIFFIASGVFLISSSIWPVWVSVRVAMSSSVASAPSSIAFALNCFVVSFFCLFSYECSAEMNDLMFFHVFIAAGLFSQTQMAASNSPDALR